MVSFFSMIIFAFGFFVFSETEETERKELHNKAEAAFTKCDYSKANEVYLDLIKKLDRRGIDWQHYVDIIMRTAETHLFLKEYKEGETLLLGLLEEKPSVELLPKIGCLLAKFYALQENGGPGYKKLKEISLLVPVASWRPEERAFFHTLESALESYYEIQQQRAKNFTTTGNFQEAICAIQEILNGLENGYYFFGQNKKFLEQKMVFRLAESRFQQAKLEQSFSNLWEDEWPDAIKVTTSTLEDLAQNALLARKEFEETLLQKTFYENHPKLVFYYESSLFEMGSFYNREGNHLKAKEYFIRLVKDAKKMSRPMLVGAISLGKIYLNEKSYQKAYDLFFAASETLNPNDPLFFEITYLLGCTAFEENKFALAASFFEKTLYLAKFNGELAKNALNKLAECTLFLSQITTDEEEKKALLKKHQWLLQKLDNN